MVISFIEKAWRSTRKSGHLLLKKPKRSWDGGLLCNFFRSSIGKHNFDFSCIQRGREWLIREYVFLFVSSCLKFSLWLNNIALFLSSTVWESFLPVCSCRSIEVLSHSFFLHLQQRFQSKWNRKLYFSFCLQWLALLLLFPVWLLTQNRYLNCAKKENPALRITGEHSPDLHHTLLAQVALSLW